MTSFEEAAKTMEFWDWYEKYENELSIYWYELGCNYEVGNEFDDWVEQIYTNNGGLNWLS